MNVDVTPHNSVGDAPDWCGRPYPFVKSSAELRAGMTSSAVNFNYRLIKPVKAHRNNRTSLWTSGWKPRIVRASPAPRSAAAGI